MAERTVSITIRNLRPSIKERLRMRAARNGRSMEAEARNILSDTLEEKPGDEINLAEAIRRRMAPLGGVDLELPPGTEAPDPISFE